MKGYLREREKNREFSELNQFCEEAKTDGCDIIKVIQKFCQRTLQNRALMAISDANHTSIHVPRALNLLEDKLEQFVAKVDSGGISSLTMYGGVGFELSDEDIRVVRQEQYTRQYMGSGNYFMLKPLWNIINMVSIVVSGVHMDNEDTRSLTTPQLEHLNRIYQMAMKMLLTSDSTISDGRILSVFISHLFTKSLIWVRNIHNAEDRYARFMKHVVCSFTITEVQRAILKDTVESLVRFTSPVVKQLKDDDEVELKDVTISLANIGINSLSDMDKDDGTVENGDELSETSSVASSTYSSTDLRGKKRRFDLTNSRTVVPADLMVVNVAPNSSENQELVE